ncbi:MAG TPA: TonB-dependent receptor [Candidatus Sulfotelmatobacter sp.]|nr:TonB-dependent receptor [Candidatus Sulfotelmatobacter sp.]
MKRCVYVFLVASLATGLSGYLLGQATATGTIQGTVTDKSQALVAGAEVVATFKATGVTRTATTTDAGSFRFDFVPAGAYQVKITKQGFATVIQTTELLVGQSATVNVTLNPGTATEIVEVTGAAPIVDLAKTSVSQDITPKEVEELPLVGRDAANLAYLVPGVKAADSYDPTKNRYAILSINGSDGRNVNTTVNGIDNKDNTVGGAVMQLPLEAVQEFQISTQRFSAENGRSQGAAINMITKSGTNLYHGSVFGYFRDSKLDTDEKDANGDGTSTAAHPDYSRQFFGGSIGGPFVKDKLFGFFAIERQRESQGLGESGNSYSELVLAQQAGLAAQPALTIPRPFHEWRYNGRADWTINNNNTAYVSYSSQANDSLNDQSDGTADLTNGNYTLNHLQIANFTLNSQFSPTVVNQFTFGFQYWNNLIASHIDAPLVTFPSPAEFGTNTNVPQQSFQRKWQFKDDISKTFGKHTLKGGVDYIYNPVEGGFFKFNSTLEIDFTQDPSTILGDTATYPQGFATPGLVGSMSYSNGDPYFLVATKQLGFYGQDDWKVTPRLTLNLGLRWDRDFNALGQTDIPKSRSYQSLLAIASTSPIAAYYTRSLPHDDHKDFSPRFGFAYDVTGAGKHVVRGGFGLYFGNSFQNIPLFMEQLANPTIFQTVLSLSASGDTVPCGGTLGQFSYTQANVAAVQACLPPPSATAGDGSVGRLIDPSYRNPVAEEFNVGYSWAINNNSVFEAEFTHVLSLHENKTINIDQKVVTGTDTSGTACSTPGTPTGCNLNYGNVILTRPLSAAFGAAGQPVLASLRNDESINRTRYDGVNFSFRQRMSRHFSLNANYTLAWAYGYDAGGFSAFRNYARDGYNPFASYEWGPMTNDERHHITVSGLVNLPKAFEFAPILQFGTARPYALSNSYNTINAGGGTTVAVVVPNNDQRNFLYGTNYISQFVATASAAYPNPDPNDPNFQNYLSDATAGARGNVATCYYTAQCTIAKFDPLRGQAFFELDAKLAKNIKIGERANVQIVAQAFNLTNKANYGNNYGGNIASGTFGHPIGFIAPTATFIPRSIWGEFGVHFTF